jgi:hypothetical protein
VDEKIKQILTWFVEKGVGVGVGGGRRLIFQQVSGKQKQKQKN